MAIYLRSFKCCLLLLFQPQRVEVGLDVTQPSVGLHHAENIGIVIASLQDIFWNCFNIIFQSVEKFSYIIISLTRGLIFRNFSH